MRPNTHLMLPRTAPALIAGFAYRLRAWWRGYARPFWRGLLGLAVVLAALPADAAQRSDDAETRADALRIVRVTDRPAAGT